MYASGAVNSSLDLVGATDDRICRRRRERHDHERAEHRRRTNGLVRACRGYIVATRNLACLCAPSGLVFQPRLAIRSTSSSRNASASSVDADVRVRLAGGSNASGRRRSDRGTGPTRARPRRALEGRHEPGRITWATATASWIGAPSQP